MVKAWSGGCPRACSDRLLDRPGFDREYSPRFWAIVTGACSFSVGSSAYGGRPIARTRIPCALARSVAPIDCENLAAVNRGRTREKIRSFRPCVTRHLGSIPARMTPGGGNAAVEKRRFSAPSRGAGFEGLRPSIGSDKPTAALAGRGHPSPDLRPAHRVLMSHCAVVVCRRAGGCGYSGGNPLQVTDIRVLFVCPALWTRCFHERGGRVWEPVAGAR